MNVSEYIVSFLADKGIKDFFGYQGTMIAYFIEAIYSNPDVRNHSCYNEQGAAFAAVGYAKVKGECAVAYATSGPGALNLVSGIADAYYDSVPVIFITGQINTHEYTEIKELRQQGFQQTDVVAVTKPVTKYSVMIDDVANVENELKKAWEIANTGRKGPVVLDIPMNIQKQEMPKICEKIQNKSAEKEIFTEEYPFIDDIFRMVNNAKRPILLLGNSISRKLNNEVKALINKLNIPVITSMPAIDLIESDDERNLGYVGAAYGFRAANIVAYKKADLILSLGASMCRRQTGNPNKFAENAQIIRVDIDETELLRKIHDDITYVADVNKLIPQLLNAEYTVLSETDRSEWINVCKLCKQKTEAFNDQSEERQPNHVIKDIGKVAVSESNFAIDVGQHQMWSAQSLSVVNGRRIIFSGGHGAMGFALPAAIGAYYATGNKTYCIAGDGAFQMNIQELQWIVREQIPITIFVMNNNSLGLIRQQQDDFFGERHYGSTKEGGFTSPSFMDIGNAYGIESYRVSRASDIKLFKNEINSMKPILIEVMLPFNTKAYPKTYFGQEMYNQQPYISHELMEELLSL